jgi:sulfate adenylyltransferase subunit 1 (EFTu-like GTPase family)
MVSWMTDRPLQSRQMYALTHTTHNVRAMVTDVAYRLDVNTLHRHEEPGGLLFVDQSTNTTVGAGMIANLTTG